LLEKEIRIEGGHNLKQLIETVQSRLREYKGATFLAQFKKDNRDLIEYIAELFKLIEDGGNKDNMDFSRYPITKKYENHFYANSFGDVFIDLPNFLERFSKIHAKLDESACYFYYNELPDE